MRPWKLVVAVLICGACLPIPMDREGLLRPDLTVSVTDVDGAPLQGVDVTLRRAETAPGPTREINRFGAMTDASGRARFQRDVTKDTVMPLMMHGVPELGFQVCATSARGTAVADLQTRPRDLTAPAEQILLQLDPGVATCPW